MFYSGHLEEKTSKLYHNETITIKNSVKKNSYIHTYDLAITTNIFIEALQLGFLEVISNHFV